jgi:hypothetical protein
MPRVLSILASALSNLYHPRTRLARALAPVLLLKIAILLTARIFWFGPMTHEVVADDMAAKLTAAEPGDTSRGDIQ